MVTIGFSFGGNEMGKHRPSAEEIQRAYGMLHLYGWRELSQSEKDIILAHMEEEAFLATV